MKKIHFENMANGYWFAVLIISLIFIIIGTFEYFDFENKKIYLYLRWAGFVIAAIYFSKGFWMKNYVRWNKKSILIRINSWSSTSLKFKDITSVKHTKKTLNITQTNGEVLSFDLDQFKEESILRLYQILTENRTIT